MKLITPKYCSIFSTYDFKNPPKFYISKKETVNKIQNKCALSFPESLFENLNLMVPFSILTHV